MQVFSVAKQGFLLEVVVLSAIAVFTRGSNKSIGQHYFISLCWPEGLAEPGLTG